jgi:hypothetical protein
VIRLDSGVRVSVICRVGQMKQEQRKRLKTQREIEPSTEIDEAFKFA